MFFNVSIILNSNFNSYILRYPLSRYAITVHKRTRTTSADEYFRRIRLLHKKMTISRRYRTVKSYGRSSGKFAITGHGPQESGDSDSDSDSYRSASISTATSSSSSCQTRNSTPLSGNSRSHSDHGYGNNHQHPNRSRRHHRSNGDSHKIHGRRTTPDHRSRYLELPVNDYDAPPFDSGRGTNTTSIATAISVPGDHCITRYSANVVLLAHGNRSLHVLTIQRSQQTYIAAQHRNRLHTTSMPTASYTTVRYKL